MVEINNENQRVEMIDTELITENPFQPRKLFIEGEIDELAESIKTHGMIQPVILRNIGERYQIVAGERRIRAAKKVGFTKIPSIVVNIDGVDVAEVSLIENIQRKNLNCIEEADAFFILKSKFGMTADDIAKRIGKSRPYVSNIIRLTALPQRVKGTLISGDISMGHGRALLSLPDEEQQLQILDIILRDSLSVRQTEELVTKMIGGEPISLKKKKKSISESLFGDALDHYNSLSAIVREIRESGGKTDVIERETDDYYEIIVRLSK